MADHEASATVRLGQFLDLAVRWLGATADAGELSHRLCRTASLLLDMPYVAICLARPGSNPLIAGTSLPSPRELDAAGATAVAAALASHAPQLRSADAGSMGAFPFRAAGALEGCLLAEIDRPLFSATEISLLRFVASLAGVMISGVEAPAAARMRATETPTPVRTRGGSDESEPTGGRNGGAAAENAARRYVAMAVHDLRNPLNVVAGYAALLEEESLGAITAEQREAVEAIGRQARVLHVAVDQLIELDRVAAHKEVHPSSFQLLTLFEDVRRTCFPDANGRVRWPGRECEFEFHSDRRRLYSVVQNLVDNALKHTADEEVYVACERSNGSLVVLVCDHGPGLSSELRNKLIAHARTGAETAPRSGLGLYSVASHVHALGGTVDVEVAPAGGTAVRVSIPPSTIEASETCSPSAIESPDTRPPAEGDSTAAGRATRRRRPARDIGSDV